MNLVKTRCNVRLRAVKLIEVHNPPTEAFRDPWQAARWRDEHSPTATPGMRFAFVNLANVSANLNLDVGVRALHEMLLPMSRAIKTGAYGSLALGVISADEAVLSYVSYLAKEHGVPLFVSTSTVAPEQSARPVGELTPGDVETLERVRALGGRVTSAELAKETGLEPAAAGNRLSNVEKKGYLFRLQRPRNQGDLFVDPRHVGDVPETTSTTEAAPVYIPAEIRAELEAVAAEHGRSPADVLANVWRAYFHAHLDEIDEEAARVDAMLEADDDDGLLEYTTADVAERAAAAARRARMKS